MLKNKEYSNDPTINKKLYDLYLENFKKFSVRNDVVDLVPDHEFEVPFTNQHQSADNRRIL